MAPNGVTFLFFCVFGLYSAVCGKAPDPPTGLELDCHSRQMNITWKVRKTALAYQLRLFKMNMMNEKDLLLQLMMKKSEFEVEIEHLQAYEVQVSSCAGLDGDSCGQPVIDTRNCPAIAPSQPRNVRSVERFKDRFTISWDVPLHLNGPLDGYYAEFIGDGEMQAHPVVIDGKASNYTFVDEVIKGDTEYNVTLRAFNYPEGGTKDSPVDEWLLSDVVQVRIKKSAPVVIQVSYNQEYLHNDVNLKWKVEAAAESVFVVSTNCSKGGSSHKTKAFEYKLTLVADFGDLCRIDVMMENASSVPKSTVFIEYKGMPRPKEIKANVDDEVKLQAEIVSPVEGSPDVQLKYQCVLNEEDFPDTFLESNICVRDLKPYTEYTIRARICTSLDNCGLVLRHNATSDVAAPSPVRSLSIYERLPEKITVKWEKPSEVNGPLDGYVVTLKTQDAEDVKIDLSSDKNNHSFEGVSKDPVYTVEIYAYNIKHTETGEVEERLKSQPEVVEVDVCKGPGEAVTVLSVASAEDGSLRISWSREAPSGAQFKAFHITVQDVEGTVIHDEITEELHCTVSHDKLKGAAKYKVSARACESVSALDCGIAATAEVETSISAPSRPELLLKKRYFNKTVVNWTDPDTPNGSLDGFRIRIMETSGADTKWTELSKDIHEYEFPTVDGIEYEIQLQAFNIKGGRSDDTKEEDFLTSPSASLSVNKWTGPPAPAKMNLYFSDVVTFTWKDTDFSSCEPSDPTNYHVYTESFDANQGHMKINQSSYSPIISLDSLAPYTEYRGRVRACCKENYVQCGDWASANVTTDPTAPSEPQYLTEKLYKDGFMVYWTFPKDINGPLDGFLVGIAGSKVEPDDFITLDRGTTEHYFDYLKDGSSNYVFVRAFNNDPKHPGVKLMSRSSTHFVDARKAPYTNMLWIIIGSALLAGALLVVFGVIIRRRIIRKRSGASSAPEIHYRAGRDRTSFVSVDLGETTRM